MLSNDITNSGLAHLGHKTANAWTAGLAQQNLVEELEEVLGGMPFSLAMS